MSAWMRTTLGVILLSMAALGTAGEMQADAVSPVPVVKTGVDGAAAQAGTTGLAAAAFGVKSSAALAAGTTLASPVAAPAARTVDGSAARFSLVPGTALAAAATAGAAVPVAAPGATTVDPTREVEKAPAPLGPGWEQFKILAQRNIFSRVPGAGGPDAAGHAPGAGSADGDLVLAGVLEKDGALEVYLENRKAGTMMKAHTGDAIGHGKIGAITLDGMEYVCEGAVTTVKIGTTLDGNAAPPATESSVIMVAPAATGMATTTTPDVRPSGGDSILERLRRKRQEELRR